MDNKWHYLQDHSCRQDDEILHETNRFFSIEKKWTLLQYIFCISIFCFFSISFGFNFVYFFLTFFGCSFLMPIFCAIWPLTCFFCSCRNFSCVKLVLNSFLNLNSFSCYFIIQKFHRNSKFEGETCKNFVSL